MQKKTTWKYSGGSDLILANAKYDREANDVTLNFSTAVVCQLDKMKELKAFQSVEQYFGNHIDFFFAGFSDHAWDETWIKKELPGRGVWHYSSEMFNKFRSEMQKKTTWKYSGGSDLILANAKYDREANDVTLNFSTAVVCQLDKMKELKAFQSVEQYFEMIFQYAEESGNQSNTLDFSDQAGVSAGRSSIKSIALSCLPKNAGKEIEKISQFAVSDIGRN